MYIKNESFLKIPLSNLPVYAWVLNARGIESTVACGVSLYCVDTVCMHICKTRLVARVGLKSCWYYFTS